MSSTKIATLSLTSPTSTIEATSLAFFRSLWIRANSTFNLSAIDVTRFAPPASGETIIEFLHSEMFSLIHFKTAGSAYKLSTGISKKPWKLKSHSIQIKQRITQSQGLLFYLYLWCMKIHCDDMISTSDGKHVSHQFSRNWCSTLWKQTISFWSFCDWLSYKLISNYLDKKNVIIRKYLWNGMKQNISYWMFS